MADYAVPGNELLAQLHTLVTYLAAHTLGIAMMFPGTFFAASNPVLVEGVLRGPTRVTLLT